MKELFERAGQEGMSYQQFCDFTEELVSEGRSTGGNANPDMIMYTRLGWQRMKRLNQQGALEEDIKNRMNEQPAQNWVVITEPWCGDSAQALPFIAKMAEANPKIDLKIILRDNNTDMIDQFLTSGSRSIPKLVGLDPENHEVLFFWGPRPEELQNMMMEYKNAEEPKMNFKDFAEKLQIWYGDDKGHTIQAEIMNKLANLKTTTNA